MFPVRDCVERRTFPYVNLLLIGANASAWAAHASYLLYFPPKIGQ